MERKGMLWADIGMILTLIGFVVLIAMFHGEDSFAPFMVIYLIAVVIWAAICENAAIRVETKRETDAEQPRSAADGSPIPH